MDSSNLKILDWQTKGHLVRFYMGKKSLRNWDNPSWVQIPYQHNSSKVDDIFVSKIIDICFDFYDILFQAEGDSSERDQEYSKNMFKNRQFPFLVVYKPKDEWDCGPYNYSNALSKRNTIKFFLGDSIQTLYDKINKCSASIL